MSIQKQQQERVSNKKDEEVGSNEDASIVKPIVKIQDALNDLRSFEQMKSRLLSRQDYQPIQGKNFIKKSGWRKLALVFNISDEVVHSSRENRADGSFIWTFRVRATAPNGRYTESVGSCDSKERRFSHLEHDVLATAQCVPLDAEILTRHGFKYVTDLKLGEEVLAYSVTDDCCHWTPLRNTTVYDALPMIRMTNTSFNVLCTPDHSWAIRKQQRKSTLSRRTPRIELRKAMSLKTGSSLVVAAKAEDGNSLLTPNEAAILGWLLTDGTMHAYNVGRFGPYMRLYIDQSKVKYINVIRKLLGENSTEQISNRSSRTFPQGHTSVLLQSHRFNLKAKFGTSLLQKAGITDIVNLKELPEIVTNLSGEAREAMLTAMLQGDGTLHGGSNWIFGVKDPIIMEVFQILATLQGYRLGKLGLGQYDLFRQSIITSRYLDISKLRFEKQEVTPAWCPTTDYGTWVMRYKGQITITGNTRSKSRAISDLIGAGEISAEELSFDDDSSLVDIEDSVENATMESLNISTAKKMSENVVTPQNAKPSTGTSSISRDRRRFELKLDGKPFPIQENEGPFTKFFVSKICKGIEANHPPARYELERNDAGQVTAVIWEYLDGERIAREISNTLDWTVRKVVESRSKTKLAGQN